MEKYPSWQSSRAQLSSYRRRQPDETALYRLVYHYREEFEYRWEELFAERFGALRPEVLDALGRYLNCGILRHGCARASCEKCNHSILIAFSCKRRGICPSCQAKRAVLFAEHLHEEILLQEPHRHLVFSIPKRLRIYFRFDRGLLAQLYQAAWEVWAEYVQSLIPEGRPGAVMALHPTGSLLESNPHIHAIALDGAVLDDGCFVQLTGVDQELLQEFFSQKVFDFLLAEGLIDEGVIDNMRSWKHSGFNFYAGEPIATEDGEGRLFVARYLKKSPLVLSHLSVDESGTEPVVKYQSHPDDAAADEKKECLFSPLEFLAALSVAVPRVFEQTTRYYGVYSPRTRGAKRQEEASAGEDNPSEISFPAAQEEQAPLPSDTWCRCIKLVFEVDPLACPRCGGAMKIKAFLTKTKEIERLCKNLGLCSWRAPPEFGRHPDTSWLDTSVEYSQLQ